MTLWMRIQLWRREAPTSHVVVTGLGIAVLVALLAAVVVSRRPLQREAEGLPVGTAFSGREQEGLVVGGTGPEESVAPGSVGGVGPSGTPARVGGGRNSPTPTGRRGGGGAAQAVMRTASDRGVTADSIKVGFVAVDIASGAGNLLGAGYPPVDTQVAYFGAMVNYANKTGGVQGRKVEYVWTKQDPLSNDSQRAACVSLSQDQKVFAAFEPGSTIGVNGLCYGEFQTPYFYGSPQTISEELWKKAGYLASNAGTGSRILQNWAHFALADGLIGPGKGKLGLVTSECAPDPDMHDRIFKPMLKSAGVEFTEARLSCDVGQAQSQVAPAILRFRQEGVDRVFMAVIFITVQHWLEVANAQGYKPQYFCSDMWGQCLNLFAENYPPEQWDGTTGYTYYWTGALEAGLGQSDPIKQCSRIYEEAGFPPIRKSYDDDTVQTTICAHFLLWLDAARRAPLNLTRRDVIEAVGRLGEYPNAWVQRAVFRPGKTEGGDSFAVVRWKGDCRCFVQVKFFRNAVY